MLYQETFTQYKLGRKGRTEEQNRYEAYRKQKTERCKCKHINSHIKYR